MARRPILVVLLVLVSTSVGHAGRVASAQPPTRASDRQASSDVLVAEGLRLIASRQFEGGSEIAADERFVFANQLDGTTARGQYPNRGGFRVLSMRGRRLIEHGRFHCPGNDNDVQPISKTIVVVAHHTNRCNPPGHGLIFVDISRPARPRVVATLGLPNGAAHTVTAHPREPYIYVSPGGFPQNGGALQTIVDISDVDSPRIVATFQPSPSGCHDLTMMERDETMFAFCSGFGETSIWDLSDPENPVVVGRIHNPAMEFMYVAQPSSDGRYLAIVDEAFLAHECEVGAGPGGVWLYDIQALITPVLVGRIPPPNRSAAPLAMTNDITTWCAAHGIAWHPEVPNLLAVAWYAAGLSVYDVTSNSSPVEAAAFQADDSLTEVLVWQNGLLYSNDLRRGVDVFRLDEGVVSDATRSPISRMPEKGCEMA